LSIPGIHVIIKIQVAKIIKLSLTVVGLSHNTVMEYWKKKEEISKAEDVSPSRIMLSTYVPIFYDFI
jgi:hypothetical protein